MNERLAIASAQSLFLSHVIVVAVGLTLAAPVLATDYTWNGGFYPYPSVPTLEPTDTLEIGSGGAEDPYNILDAGTIASLTNEGTITATADLYFAHGAALYNDGVYDLATDVGLYGSAYGGGIVNSGLFKKSGGTGLSVLSYSGPGNVPGGIYEGTLTFTNNGGTIEADTGTIEFASGFATFNSGSVFQGAGTINVTYNAAFNGLLTSSNLVLSGGLITGTSAELAGNLTQPHSVLSWTGGSLQGTWTVDAGQNLAIQPGSPKLLDSGSLYNSGTISATDDLYLAHGAILTNSSLYQIQGDVGLYGSAYGGTIVNTGTFEKSAGTGVSVIGDQGPACCSLVGAGTLTFNNNGGTIKADTGTINFVSGSANFNAGSAFTGAGVVEVSNNAAFNGAFTSSNLVLAGGLLTGTNAELAGSVSQPNSSVSWTGGSLQGTWTVDAGQTLAIQPGSPKLLDSGSLYNSGTITATDDLTLAHGATLTNNGTYSAQGNVSVIGGAYGGTFANNGAIVKSGPGTTTALNTFAFSNNVGASMLIQSGTVQLADGFDNKGLISIGSNAALTVFGSFTNDGTLQGTGIVNGNLTNNGHVAPGDAPGTLSLTGNYVQGSTGYLDVGLAGGGVHSIFNISGTATLDGTVDVACAGACSYSAGTMFEILTTGSSSELSGDFAHVVETGFTPTSSFTTTQIDGNEWLVVGADGAAGVAPVPLPANLWLLLSGLGGIGVAMRRRTEATGRFNV